METDGRLETSPSINLNVEKAHSYSRGISTSNHHHNEKVKKNKKSYLNSDVTHKKGKIHSSKHSSIKSSKYYDTIDDYSALLI